ncbi:MAG: asparaginase [Anaerolineae bacterium]|nr:asparaginase [Anaerolineae bacterium]
MAKLYCEPMIEITRGALVESIHFGAMAVVDANGRLVASVGDVNEVLYLRSSSKPFQTMPLVEMGGLEAYGLTQKELAITCASHQGTDDHVDTLVGMHKKIGITLEHLQCGIHPPADRETYDAMILRGEMPNAYRHNCSGKHTGILAQAKMQGHTLDDYMKPEHPTQQRIIRTFAEMVGMEPQDVVLGIDGCSVPVFGVPLWKAAFGYARLCDPANLPEPRKGACKIITAAMMAHPEMVSGPHHSLDTTLMQALPGKVVSKGGADGYQAIGVLPGVISPESPGLGITMKFTDGDAESRARGAASVKVLHDLGVFETIPEILQEFAERAIQNVRGFDVGNIQCRFSISG